MFRGRLRSDVRPQVWLRRLSGSQEACGQESRLSLLLLQKAGYVTDCLEACDAVPVIIAQPRKAGFETF